MNKQQLALRIWQSANKMRSKIEANEYKDYILGFIFYKFLSEQEESFLKSQGMDDDDMPSVIEEDGETVEYLQRNIGYFIAYENLFSTWLGKGKDFDVSDVRDALSAFGRLISPTHKKVFEGIFRTLETGLSKLGENSTSQTKAIRELIHLIKDIPMDGKQDYDVLGFIYEYLISMFAANAGKKAGEFYTPHEVSQLMSEIVADHLKGKPEIKIYDPTSGSGSLLINIGAAVAKRLGSGGSIKYYAQELKENTYNLTRMNLVMRGISPDNIVTRNGDTLAEDWPWFDDNDPAGTYDPLYVDAVVSNPPYSQNWDPDTSVVDPRFDDYGWAPKSKADFAFLLHDLYHLRPDGIMCIVLPHGVLFRGGEEGQIRKALVERNHIQAIIGLPANIFFGTGIPTIVMVLRQKRVDEEILIIDASKGFEKVGKNNKLRASDIKKIVDAVTKKASIDKFSRLVGKQEVRGNDYNLNIPRYVDSSEPAESWDINSIMFGGIPTAEVDDLAAWWSAFPGLRESLFQDRGDGTSNLISDSVSDIVGAHGSVASFRSSFDVAFGDFGAWLYDELVEDVSAVHIASEEQKLADDVFARLSEIPLIDKYQAYQLIDDAWVQIAEDLEVIQTEGSAAIRQVDPNMVTKKKSGKDVEVQDGWIGHIIPFGLVQATLLHDELESLKAKRDELTSVASELEELVETATDEEKSTDAFNDAGDAFVAAAVGKMLRSDSLEPDFETKLRSAKNLIDKEKKLKKEIKADEASLDELTKETVEGLSDDSVFELLEAKWVSPLVGSLYELPENAIAELCAKVRALAEKYKTTFAEVDQQIEEAEASLVGMLKMLKGSDRDMAGLAELVRLLGGER